MWYKPENLMTKVKFKEKWKSIYGCTEDKGNKHNMVWKILKISVTKVWTGNYIGKY